MPDETPSRWETVCLDTDRLEVPGGWLCRAVTNKQLAVVFVPYGKELQALMQETEELSAEMMRRCGRQE